MLGFLKRLVGFSLGPIIGAAISFFTTPLYTNNLSTAEYGKAQVFLSTLLVIQSFLYLGMDQAYTREFNEADDEVDLFQQSIILPLILGGLIFVLISLFPKQCSNFLFGTPNEIGPTIAFALVVLLMVVERFILLYIRMHERSLEYSSFNIVLKFNTLFIAACMIWAGTRDFRVVVYATAFGQILADLYLIIRYRSLLNFKAFKPNKPLIKKMLNFGIPVMISALVFSSLKQLDIFFLNHYCSDETLGIYGSAQKVASLIGIFKTAFTSFWVPTAYRWYDEKKPMKNFSFISDLVMFVMTAAFFVIVFAKDLIVKILGSNYYEASYLMPLLALPELLYTASETTTLGIVFSRKSKLNVVVSLVSIIPTVVLNMILTPRYGGLGAAVSSTAGFMVFFALRTYFSNRTGFKIPVRSQFIAVFIMLACGIFNATGKATVWANLIFLVLAVLVQAPVLKDLKRVFTEPDYIDFS